MAERRSMPQANKKLAAIAAVLLLAAWQVAPANAASNSHILSDEVAHATLHIPVSNLTTEIAVREAESAIRLLAPRAEAAIREAFKDVATSPMAEATSTPEAIEVDDAQTETPRGMNTRLPGVSEKDLSLFRKQMYRKDI